MELESLKKRRLAEEQKLEFLKNQLAEESARIKEISEAE